MELMDFHCHLDLYPDPRAIAAQATAIDMFVLSVTTTPSAFEGTSALVSKDSRIKTALGLHPELAVERVRELPLFEKLLPRTDYVGEIGLDGSRGHRKTLDHQAHILMDILMMCASSGGKIISLHSREARSRLLELLSLEPLAGTAILHWFSGSTREIEYANDLNCWFSVGPAMLASENGRSAVSKMPKNRVVPETDGPFGKVNGEPLMPWNAMDIDEVLASVWKETKKDVRQMLISNSQLLHSLGTKNLTQ